MSSRADLEVLQQLLELNRCLRRIETKLDTALHSAIGMKLTTVDGPDGPVAMPVTRVQSEPVLASAITDAELEEA